MKITIPSRISAPPGSSTEDVHHQAALTASHDGGAALITDDATKQTAKMRPPSSTAGSSSTPGFSNPPTSKVLPATPSVDETQSGQKRKRKSASPQATVALPSGMRSGDAVYQDGMKLYTKLKDFRKDGWILSTDFMELPPREYFPDYYQVIKKPLAFSDVKAKLERGEYANLKGVHDDFHQMFINAKRYNQSGSDIFNYAKRLDRLVKTTYTTMSGGREPTDESDADGDVNEQSRDMEHDVSRDPPAHESSANMANNTLNINTVDIKPTKPAKEKKPKNEDKPPKKKIKSLLQVPGGKSVLTGKEATAKPPQPPNGMTHTQWAMQLAVEENKPMTITRWLMAKLDDLISSTDADGRGLADLFMVLPKQELYPDYYKLILRPIAFVTVKARLKNRNYNTIESFNEDVERIFENAQYYNEEGSQVHNDAEALKKIFRELMSEEPPEFFYRQRKRPDAIIAAEGQRSESPDKDPGSRLRIKLDQQGGGLAGITVSMGRGGIENIAFADSFDDAELGGAKAEDTDANMAFANAAAARSRLQQQYANQQVSPGQIPLHLQSAPPMQPKPAPQPVNIPVPVQRQTPRPKVVSQMIHTNERSALSKFTVMLSRNDSSTPVEYVLPNDTVRQHAVHCSADIERIDITPYLGSMKPSEQNHITAHIRPMQTSANELTSPDEQSEGAADYKWLLRPANGLMQVDGSAKGLIFKARRGHLQCCGGGVLPAKPLQTSWHPRAIQ